jgi:hypothetical protein
MSHPFYRGSMSRFADFPGFRAVPKKNAKKFINKSKGM